MLYNVVNEPYFEEHFLVREHGLCLKAIGPNLFHFRVYHAFGPSIVC